jgi:hypothetical protein
MPQNSFPSCVFVYGDDIVEGASPILIAGFNQYGPTSSTDSLFRQNDIGVSRKLLDEQFSSSYPVRHIHRLHDCWHRRLAKLVHLAHFNLL